MKKNFLLLMLMALLPLAGWTQISISGVTPTIGADSYYYTNSTPTITMTVPSPSSSGNLTATTDYTVRFYNADEEEITASNVKAVGTYYIAAAGTGGYEGVSQKVQFNIIKMPLVLKGTAGSKTYGTAADGTVYTLNGTEGIMTKYNSPSAKVDLTSTLKDKVTFARTANEAKGTYDITATITDEAAAGNYSIASADITTDGTTQAKFAINAKTFVKGTGTIGVTITIDDSGLTYTGETQEPNSITVTDNALGTTLVKGTDYTVDFGGDKKSAGAQSLTFTGIGNYQTSTTVSDSYTIAAATIMVRPIATKEYNGNNTLPTVPANATDNTAAQATTGSGCYFKFQGFVNGEAESIITYSSPAWTWNDAEDATANASATPYVLKINGDVNTMFTATNYQFVAQTGTYTITKKDLTAVAADDTQTYGETKTFGLKTTDSEALPTAVAADYTALRNAIKVVKAETAETTGANAGKFKLTPAFKTEAEIDATTGLDAAAKTAAKTALGNYNLATATPGYLTYSKAPLTIALDESYYSDYYTGGKLQKVYDGQPIPVASLLDKENGLIISGKINESDVVNLDNLTLTVAGGTNDGSYKATPYTLQLSGATAEDYNISYVASSFTITQRTLTLEIANQTFVKGTVPSINQSAYTITDTDEDAGIAAGDEGKVFKLAFATGTVSVDTDGKITTAATATPIANAIEAVDCGATDTKWANYNVVMTTKGSVTILADAATTIILDQTKDMTATLTAQNDVACTVSFPTSQRTLKADTWNTLVLPFAISVKDLSAALDYAVVDVIDAANDDANKVIFKIYMGEIAANTPFMVKAWKDIDLNNVVFSGVTIKHTATTAPEAADAAGNKLTGAYKPLAVADGEYYMNTAGAWKLYSGTGFNINGERAKFTKSANATAPEFNIFIEEIDGSVTAISSISAEGEAVAADGWYTLNGIRLEGAPTEKGVYVRNGKKVVIK